MSSRRTSSVPKDVFPRMLYCDSRCSQTLTGLSPVLPGALLCNATRRLGDRQREILRQRVRGSVRAIRAVRNTRVFQTETRVVADESRAWWSLLNLYIQMCAVPSLHQSSETIDTIYCSSTTAQGTHSYGCSQIRKPRPALPPFSHFRPE